MAKVDVYNSDYVELNHAYNVIFHSYEQLIECDDADDEVLSALEAILRTMNPTLDRIKSEMTVKTRYKEDPSEKTQQKVESVAPNVITGNFTGE